MINNIIYFVIAVLIMFVFIIIDGISHQKFKKKASITFHVIGGAIFLASLIILVIKEFQKTIFIYPGIIFIIVGLIVVIISFLELKENFNFARKIIKTKIYSKIRHPVYLGCILCLIGLSLFTYSLVFFIYAFLTIIMIFWLISYEEKHLLKKFKEYKKYKNKVSMLFPYRK